MTTQLPSYLHDVDDVDYTVLEETLSKIASLTDQMTSSLHTLGRSASRAERAIKPIAGQSRMMAIYEKNLADSLNVVHGIRDYASVTEECESIIVKGPEVVGIPAYASTLERLNNALEDLQNANLQTFYKVIEKAEMLVKKGNANLKDYFRKLLSQMFQTIDVSDYVSKDIRLPVIKTQEMMTLRQLYNVFKTHSKIDHREPDKIYFEICSKYIKSSLSTLEGKSRPPQTPPTPSIDQVTATMSTNANQANSSNGAGNGLPSSAANILNISKAPPYERGSNAIVKYADALSLLLSAEFENCTRLFPDNKGTQDYYFEHICTSSLSDFVNLSNNICKHVRTHLATDSMLAFEVIEAIGHLINTVKMITKIVPTVLSTAMKDAQDTTHLIFTEFIKYIEFRVQNLISLPSDNGVCDATIDVMSRMKRFADHKNSALVSISTMNSEGWLSNPKPTWYTTFTSSGAVSAAASNPVELLSSYFSDAIDALFVSLELKAKFLQKKTTQVGFFLLTNLTLIERYVTKSDIYMILGATGSDRLERLKKRGLNLFLVGYVTLFFIINFRKLLTFFFCFLIRWKNAASLLMDVTVVKGSSSSTFGKSSLSSKDREAIKEKFKNFNAEFETLVKAHKSYNITDQSLRQLLAKEVTFISPLYHRFYDKHSGGDFSKHVDKVSFNYRFFFESTSNCFSFSISNLTNSSLIVFLNLCHNSLNGNCAFLAVIILFYI